jgi:hypothetical protein
MKTTLSFPAFLCARSGTTAKDNRQAATAFSQRALQRCGLLILLMTFFMVC